ncbi:hypothetical protein C5748_08715 [Phyllobacterium phragmitis]|uniref:Uncharacterized protein n=1 Tax=Phyllobacterium phragmitis TaxID=2670329 RepID=A0A2S9ITT3_9HYPH|nr:hypothetical protein [Phyllobacterium phragmitis]PRD43921.1 hypothetical protein C5748_08715 [Phyllobacterium phragmitis]
MAMIASPSVAFLVKASGHELINPIEYAAMNKTAMQAYVHQVPQTNVAEVNTHLFAVSGVIRSNSRAHDLTLPEDFVTER